MKKLHKMREAELWAFFHRYSRASRAEAAELCQGRTFAGYTKAVKALANYACNLAVAKGCRRRGDRLGVRIYHKCADVAFEGTDGRLNHLL